MADDSNPGSELDERVSEDASITFTRDPQLSHDLVTGPYPYARSEQNAIENSCQDIMKQYQRGTRPETIFTDLRVLAARTNGELSIESDDDDLIGEGTGLDFRVRLGLRGGDMHIEQEPVDDQDS